jgi:hypothetical protein
MGWGVPRLGGVGDGINRPGRRQDHFVNISYENVLMINYFDESAAASRAQAG